MDDSEDNMSADDIKVMVSPSFNKSKPKKRSLVERELETSLTARVTSPMTTGESGSTSRYGRARRLKTDADYIDTEKGIKLMNSPVNEKTPVKIQSPVYKMHASNSPIKKEPKETPKKVIITDSSLENQIENIYNENISLSRFGSDEKKHTGNKFPKVYVRKDLIQTREKEEYVMMIKNMFSPNKSSQKSNSHLNNILERSSEKYSLNTSIDNTKSHNGFVNNSSVVKTLDFDNNKKKKKENRDGRVVLSKSDLFELEAKCEYQVGDLAWARMGTFPFWPCIVTREPASGMFVKKKLFGRIERDIIHVTFFGDNGRRGWIVDTMLRKFLGQLEFEATRETFSPSAKKRDPRLYAAFFVSEKKMPQWNISVEEAETLLREPKRLRIDILYDMLAKTRCAKSTPKQHKSGKITRTASDVASDVSLSESLYDTLFSEDDGKSEDTERSRSKPRMSLDVSEVVTACLDNMAAKTGITKIQRQSHMDRWLQKAKSKTPEKSQVNLLVPQKEKEVKLASAKKKKKIPPVNVPVQKPYSFRKTSYEPQILKSHDNEHDYSTKVRDDPPKSGDSGDTAGYDIGLIVKVESLRGNDGKSDNTDTDGDRITDDIDTTDSEAPKEGDPDVIQQINANEAVEIGPIDITEETIDEIQENMCSVEENDELLLGHTDTPTEISQVVNNLSTIEERSIAIDTKNQFQSTKIPEEDINNGAKQFEIKNQVDESLEMSNKPEEHKMDVDLAEIVESTSENNTEKEKSIGDPSVTAAPNMSKEKPVIITQIPNRITRASAHNKINTDKVIKTKMSSDSIKRSAEFDKYLELRQDAVMDEHPELSQAEIDDYLYKTWQYEESSKSDFKKEDEIKQSGLVKGLNTRQRQHKKCLSLHSNAGKKHSKKREEDRSPMNSFLSGTSAGRSFRTKLSNSPVASEDANNKMTSKEKSTAKPMNSTQLVTEHSNTDKNIKMTPNLDEQRSSTTKTRFSNSAAKLMDLKDIINIAIKEDNTGIHPEITLTLNEQVCDETKLPECDINTNKAETTPIVPNSTTIRRSLRTRLSNSPCTSMDASEKNISKESSTVGTVKSSRIVTEHSCIENKPEMRPKRDEQVKDTTIRSECNKDTEKNDKITQKLDEQEKSSLKTSFSNSAAKLIDPEDIINSAVKEDKTEIHPEVTQKLNETKLLECETIKHKAETTSIVGSASVRRSLRTRLSKSPCTPMDSTEIITSKESSTVGTVNSAQIVTEFSDIQNKPGVTTNNDENVKDLPIRSECNADSERNVKITPKLDEQGTSSTKTRFSNSAAKLMDPEDIINSAVKEDKTEKHPEVTQKLNETKLLECETIKHKAETTPIVGSASVRRSLRTRLSKSPCTPMDSTGIITSKESSTVRTVKSTQIVTEFSVIQNKPGVTTNNDENVKDLPIRSVCNADSENNVKITPKLDEPETSTPNTRFLNSAAKLPLVLLYPLDPYPEDIIHSAIKEDKTEKLPEVTQKLNEQGLDETKLPECDMNKNEAETAPVFGSSSVRRSLRTRLSNSPSTSTDATKNITSQEFSKIGTVKTSQVVIEYSDLQNKLGMTPQHDARVNDTPIRSECNTDTDKNIKTTPKLDEQETSLTKTEFSNSAAKLMDPEDIINCAVKEDKTEKHPKVTQKLNKQGLDETKLPECDMNKDKAETTPVVCRSSVRRSFRTRLSNSPSTSMDATEKITSKESSAVGTVKSTQIVTEYSDIQNKPEVMPKNDEHVKNTPKRSECNMDKYKTKTTPVVDGISVRRSLRKTRLLSSTAMFMETNAIVNSVGKENSSVKAIESTELATEPSCSKNRNKIQKLDVHETDKPIQVAQNIETAKVLEEHNTSTDKRTETVQIADEPKIDKEKQEDIQTMDEDSNERRQDERIDVTEKQIVIHPVSEETRTNTDKPIGLTQEVVAYAETHNEIMQNVNSHDLDPKLPIEITTLPSESIQEVTEKSEPTEDVQKTDPRTIHKGNPNETTEITDQSCKDTTSPLDVSKTVMGHSIDNKNETNMIEHADAVIPNSISEITERSNICTKNQTEMTLVMNNQLTKHDQADVKEDNEYGHLDFVFSSIYEKLLATNDISKPVIKDNEIVSVNEIINAECIDTKRNENIPNCSKAILKGSVSENVGNKKKGTTIDNLDKCKYKNLYERCNELSVRIERLPRLSHTIIKIKDLDKEILICKARQNGVINKIDINDKNSTVANKIPAENSHVEPTYISHTTDILIKNVPRTTVNETNEIKMSIDDESIGTCGGLEKVKDVIDQKLTNENDKSEYSGSKNNEVFDAKVSLVIPESNQTDKSIDSRLNLLSKDDCLPNVNSTKDNQDTVDCQPVPIENSKPVECPQIELSVVNENLSLSKNQLEYSEDNEDLQPLAITNSKIIECPQIKPRPVVNENILPNKHQTDHNQDEVKLQPVVIVKSENAECLQIKPSPLVNGFQYIFDDDDEEEFESPAFSPIFKEPINPTPDQKEDEYDNNNDSKAVADKNETKEIETSSKDGPTVLPFSKESAISTENKNQVIVTSTSTKALNIKESNVENDKDELMTSVSRLPEPVKINGFHQDEEYGIDFSDNDFNVETSSINSEDSEPLSVTKIKILSKNRINAKKALQNVEFLKYLELRQDVLMDEHPELNQEEIVEYLYKTWQYEENSKSDIRKNDDIEQLGLVKGLNDNLRQKSIRNSYRENKKRNKKRDEDTLSIDSNISTKRSKKGDDDTISLNSDGSDTSIRRRLRTRFSNSPAISIDENEFSASKESSPERKPDVDDKMSVDSDDSIKITKRKVRNQILDDSLDGDENFPELKSKDKSPVNKTAKIEESRPKRSLDKKENKSPKSYKDSKIEKYFGVVNSSKETTNDHVNEINTLDVDKKIKEEFDPETVSISSMNSEDSEVSLSKRKQRKNADKQTTKTMDDPEFLKYVELRQDILIDENPQLTQEEIVAYLFKTWLYEESIKSDLKKSDDIEQANLVKGLNLEVQPKRAKKKIKVEKAPVDDEVATKEKPKRKISQPYYNEDTISDIEDEIELFEIFKTKTNPVKSEESNGEIKKTTEGKSSEHVKTEGEEIVIQDEVDEVELYFSQLPLPKPNIFKGLVREKVCEICEKTGNLVKCKGCSSMFHVSCDMKEQEKEAVVASTRGRKKKKKPGRKPKNLEDSGSQSDEKSQDISEENNVSIEEVETEPRVVDEAVLEAALSAKMREIMPTIDLTYDSYSSDDGVNWDSVPPGHCEIVDVKVKPKIVIDYSDFKCKNCQKYTTPVCFVCKEAVSKSGVDHRQKCQTNHCNKYYHLECLDHWPQTQFNSGEPSKNNKKANEHFEAVMCPRHVCHTCVSDDPRGCRTRFSGDKLARCVRCPATYHSFTKCIPAGTQILTGSLIVCPRHYQHRPGKVPCHVNTGWCFICALGGSLICCEYCPTSFHAECLNIKPPEGGYMCEDCETGRLPLYGEMVWVKLGHYRWWPGIILHPSEIPENILAVKHSPGEFVVRFFGQYDHYWVNRGRVFPFQEGDSGRISTQKSKIDAAFITAMEHAHRAFEILKTAEPNEEEASDIASSLLPPHYVKLKVNKPCGSLVGWRPDVEESSLTQCECEPMVEDPCGPYSHCLNRMLLTECGPICRAGDRCLNRAFEKRLYPKMVPYRTPHRGWGLKTLEDIKAGQFVIEYVGELIDEEEFRRRMNRMHEIRDENFYFLTLDKERMIDAGPKGNLARFMNHCCEPNCETQKWTVLGDVRVGLFAINDIPANSELTFNYNLECAGIEKKRCLCGARRCSGYIGAKPKQEESQPKKKRTYKKRAKPVEESPSTSKNKPKRPVGRPAKPRELTDIEKDLLIIKNATNGLSSDSETSSRLSSIDNLNPKALKRKRVSFSTEESVCSSPSSKRTRMEDSSPSTKKDKNENSSPSTKKAKIEDSSPDTKKAKIEANSPCTKKVEHSSPSTKKAQIEDSSPSTKKAKIEDSSPDTKKAKIEANSPCTKKVEHSSPSTKKAKIEDSSPSNKKAKIEDSSPSTKEAKIEENSPSMKKIEESEVGD